VQQYCSPVLAQRVGVHGPPLVWLGSHSIHWKTHFCESLHVSPSQHGRVEQPAPDFAHNVQAPPTHTSGDLGSLQHIESNLPQRPPAIEHTGMTGVGGAGSDGGSGTGRPLEQPPPTTNTNARMVRISLSPRRNTPDLRLWPHSKQPELTSDLPPLPLGSWTYWNTSCQHR